MVTERKVEEVSDIKQNNRVEQGQTEGQHRGSGMAEQALSNRPIEVIEAKVYHRHDPAGSVKMPPRLLHM